MLDQSCETSFPETISRIYPARFATELTRGYSSHYLDFLFHPYIHFISILKDFRRTHLTWLVRMVALQRSRGFSGFRREFKIDAGIRGSPGESILPA